MNQAKTNAVLVSLAVFLCIGQTVTVFGQVVTSPAKSGPRDGTGGTVPIFQVQFPKALHSALLKVGDEVIGMPSDVAGVRTLSPGSKVIGHVKESTARSNGDLTSSLGIVFEKISFGHGREIAITGVIRALGPKSFPNLDYLPTAATPPATLPLDPHDTPKAPPKHSVKLDEGTARVVGMPDLQLGPNGVLISTQGEVSVGAKAQFTVQAMAR